MDIWKFYDITHREHRILNPTSDENIAQLIGLLRLEPGSQVVDIACGKGEFLIHLAETYRVGGIGVDISPYFISEAHRRHQSRVPTADLRLIHGDAATTPIEPHSFDLASCLGATWVFGGYKQTLEALAKMVKPRDWIIVGHPYLRHAASPEYLTASGDAVGLGTHADNAETGEQLGLHLVHAIVSGKIDFDKYEGLQWYAVDRYAHEHPDDPDLLELMRRVAESKQTYLRWGRDTLGWAMYMFRAVKAANP